VFALQVADGDRRRFGFGSRHDHVTSMIDPGGKSWKYTYNVYGDRTSGTDAEAQSVAACVRRTEMHHVALKPSHQCRREWDEPIPLALSVHVQERLPAVTAD